MPAEAGLVVVPVDRTAEPELQARELLLHGAGGSCLTTILGMPMDVTVEELALESFYPAENTTAAALRRRSAS